MRFVTNPAKMTSPISAPPGVVAEQPCAQTHAGPLSSRRLWRCRLDDLWVPGALGLGIIVGLLTLFGGQFGLGQCISKVLGWTYFCAWSVSFYPQLFLNRRRRSVVGLSLDFQILNFVGFGFYFAFNALLFWSTGIQDSYRAAHDGNDSAVKLNDVVFAGHAFLVTAVTLLQIGMYNDYAPLARTDRLVRYAVLIFLFVAVFGAAAMAIFISTTQKCCAAWLTFLTLISEVKVVISVVKYCPQVWMNYMRKSTEGWNIQNVQLDFTGGLLSVAQLVLDAGMSNDWSAISGDPAKFTLGNVSIFFDVIFMMQHYCLYADAKLGAGGNEQLLQEVASSG